jgi:hypothetical protein
VQAVAGRNEAVKWATEGDLGTPFNVAAAFSRLNLRARCTWLAVGALTSIVDRDRFVRPTLNDAAVAVHAVHALWRHSRSHRTGGHRDRVLGWADLGANAAAFGLVSAAAAPGDQFDMITNWVFAISLFDVADAGMTLDAWEAALIGTLVAAMYAAIALGRSRGSARPGVGANTVQIMMFAAAGIWIARIMTRGEADFDAINARYRAEQAEAARQFEIDAARRHLMHAIQRAAADIGDLLTKDRRGARQRATAIATQLRAVLALAADAPGQAFRDAILGGVVEAATDGLTVETTFRIDVDVDTSMIEPLVAALRAALDNIVHHARTDRAVLRVLVDTQHIQMTLRDRGSGRQELRATDIESVAAALTELPATVEVSSSADEGTRIRIAVPT